MQRTHDKNRTNSTSLGVHPQVCLHAHLDQHIWVKTLLLVAWLTMATNEAEMVPAFVLCPAPIGATPASNDIRHVLLDIWREELFPEVLHHCETMLRICNNKNGSWLIDWQTHTHTWRNDNVRFGYEVRLSVGVKHFPKLVFLFIIDVVTIIEVKLCNEHIHS